MSHHPKANTNSIFDEKFISFNRYRHAHADSPHRVEVAMLAIDGQSLKSQVTNSIQLEVWAPRPRSLHSLLNMTFVQNMKSLVVALS